MSSLIIDIELTLNRFGFYRVSTNKIQIAMFRFSIWRNIIVGNKYAISFEINYVNTKRSLIERKVS